MSTCLLTGVIVASYLALIRRLADAGLDIVVPKFNVVADAAFSLPMPSYARPLSGHGSVQQPTERSYRARANSD
jgi:hypothetical protein